MAKIDTLKLWRLRLADLPRKPWLLGLLLVGDLVELSLSLALAAASAEAPARAHASYATFDVPFAPPPVTRGAAFLGLALGLWLGAMLVAELVVLVRRAQIMRYRYGTRRSQRSPGAMQAAAAPVRRTHVA